MISSKFSSQTPQTPLIIRFYDPDVQAKDTRGRTQEQMLSWSDNELESCHNYIQMLFPLPEGSPFNFAAPVIDLQVMQAFHARSELRSRLKTSFERMLGFYGFQVSTQPEADEDEKTTPQQGDESTKHDKDEQDNQIPQQPTTTPPPTPALTATSPNPSLPTYNIIRAPHFCRASATWTRRFDHNHLRITRILRCLRVLGLQRECDAFFAALKSVYNDPGIHISERSMMYWKRAVTRPLFVAPDGEEVEWLRVWEEGQGEREREREKEGKRKREGEGGDERDE